MWHPAPVCVAVHLKLYVPAPPAGVKIAALLVVLENCVKRRLGPLVTDHVPAPPGLGNEFASVIALAASVTEPEQIDCVVPALATGVITPFNVRSSMINAVPAAFAIPYNLN